MTQSDPLDPRAEGEDLPHKLASDLHSRVPMAGARAYTCVHKDNKRPFLEITCEKSYENESETSGVVSMRTIDSGCVWCFCVCRLKWEHGDSLLPSPNRCGCRPQLLQGIANSLLPRSSPMMPSSLPIWSLATLPWLTVSDSGWKRGKLWNKSLACNSCSSFPPEGFTCCPVAF